MNIKRMIKRFCVRYKIWYRNNFLFYTVKAERNESVACSLCRNLIIHNDSEFLIAPLSLKKYIKNDILGIFIILYNQKLSITNHIFHYDIDISVKNFNKLCKQYDNKVEKKREEYETSVKSQITHSLSSILDKLDK
jgi:hypothetical protein